MIDTVTAQDVIAAGFGKRLKEERRRMGLSQTEFAKRANAGRLAQSQYETEATFPTIRYLALIAEAGADITYLLFDRRQVKLLPPEEERQIRIRAFDLLEKYVEKECGGKLVPEARTVIFDVIVGLLSNAARKGEVPDEREIIQLLSNGSR